MLLVQFLFDSVFLLLQTNGNVHFFNVTYEQNDDIMFHSTHPRTEQSNERDVIKK